MPRELPWKLEENTRVKPASQLTFGARRWPLSLGGLVEQFRQVPGSQGLVFDDNSSDPDPHEKKILAGHQFADIRGESSRRF